MLNNSNQGNLISQIASIRNMLSGRNPDELYNEMMRNNPQFRAFVEANINKTAEQIASENGINLDNLKSML